MQTIWVSPTEYVTGDPTLVISHPFAERPSTVVTCTAPGDFKKVWMGLRLPPNVKIEQILLCYQVSSPDSFIPQVQLMEMTTPNQAFVRHDDPTGLKSTSPACYTSKVSAFVPTAAVTLALRLNFQNTTDQILLGAVGVRIRSAAEHCANVKDFGAIGDGRSHPLSERYASLADARADYPKATSLEDEIDWAAIQAAIDAATTAAAISPNNKNALVYFPLGKYKITKFLDITASVPLTLQGEGYPSEIVISNTDDGLAAQGSSAPLAIRRLKFSGSYARAITLSSGTSTTEIDHCDFSGATRMPTNGFQSPIFIVGQNDVWITNNFIHECGEQGAKTAKTYAIGSDTLLHDMCRWHIIGNTIRSAGTTVQIALYDLSDSEIVNNMIDGGGGSAIWDGYADGYGVLVYRAHGTAASPQGNRVSGNTVKNCAGSGIYLQNVPNTTVSGNVVTDCALAMSSRTPLLVGSIVAVIGANMAITSNVIKGGNRRGIAVQSHGATIVGNAISGTAEHAILIDGIDGTVTRNVVVNNVIDTTRGSMAEILGRTGPGFAVAADAYVDIKIDTEDLVRTSFQACDSGSLNNIVYRINQAFAEKGLPGPAVGANSGSGYVHDTLLLQSTLPGPGAVVQVVGGSGDTLDKLGLTAQTVHGSTFQHGICCALTATACTISQNVVNAIQGQGISLGAGCRDTTISENHVSGCPNAQAYAIVGGSNNVIAKNHAVSNSNNGFDLRCSGSLIQGNHAHCNGHIGMFVYAGSNNRVLDNDCTGNAVDNLLVSMAPNTTRAGNVVASQDATRSGIVTLEAGKGQKWVDNKEVIPSSRLRLTRKTADRSLGHLSYSVSAGVGFTITSSDQGDTSSVEWEIVH